MVEKLDQWYWWTLLFIGHFCCLVLSVNLQWKFWGGEAITSISSLPGKESQGSYAAAGACVEAFASPGCSHPAAVHGAQPHRLNLFRKNVSSRGHGTGKSFILPFQCLFQFILKMNHLLSQLNVIGLLFCLNSKSFWRLITASVCSQWIIERQASPL